MIVSRFKTYWAVWENQPDYKDFEPLEIFVTYKQAMDYCRTLGI